jgi:hypothetical protein
VTPQHGKYKDRNIEIRKRGQTYELLIDNAPMQYGELPGGLYYLHEYAYDWTDNLMDLSHKFIDYQSRVDKIRQEGNLEKRRVK